ncbi:MAG TPA: hypothetical protein VNK43_06685 [Gemmatimonadales bacterium]|nr:hypothetical protein [Gemmatimonadales bacterium]
MPHTRFPPVALAALALALFGCSDSDGPGSGCETRCPAGEFNFVELAPDAPPLYQDAVTFWAYTHRDGEARLYFRDPQTGGPGEEFVRLRIDAGALLARPDGSPFGAVDSIRVTLRVVDPAVFQVELEPSGLAFNPLEPAELKFHYNHADYDFDDDDDVDEEDLALEGRLTIWRQERPGDPFVRLSSLLQVEIDEVEAELLGFSRYAISY